jgi:hypothetical protein
MRATLGKSDIAGPSRHDGVPDHPFTRPAHSEEIDRQMDGYRQSRGSPPRRTRKKAVQKGRKHSSVNQTCAIAVSPKGKKRLL